MSAWIPLIVGVLSFLGGVLATFYAPMWKARRDRRQQIQDLFVRYSFPLLRAAYDLQSRLYNIARLYFFKTYYWSEPGRHYAEASTLWLVGQYLGWVEILRREVQFLEVGSTARDRRLQHLLLTVANDLATDSIQGDALRLFRSTQRAIGEVMIVERATEQGVMRNDCMGFAEFSQRLQDDGDLLDSWFQSLRAGLAILAAEDAEDGIRDPRLVRVQRSLVDLVDFLDPDRARFSDRNVRGKLALPPRGGDEDDLPSRAETVSKFVLDRDADPWRNFEEWVRRNGIDVEIADHRSKRTARQMSRMFGVIL